MDDVKTTVAKNILFYRKQRKMSQKELAEAIGVKHNTISSWESCTNTVDIDSLSKICFKLGVSVSEMFGTYANTSTVSALGAGAELTGDAAELVADYGKLNCTGKVKARDYTRDLTEQTKYTAAPDSSGADNTNIGSDIADTITKIAAVQTAAKQK